MELRAISVFRFLWEYFASILFFRYIGALHCANTDSGSTYFPILYDEFLLGILLLFTYFSARLLTIY